MMIYTMHPRTAEAAGRLIESYKDRGPSSDRNALQGFAEFLISLGAIRDGAGNQQASSISLTVDK